MLRRVVTLPGALLLTLLMLGAAGLLSSDAWWGINHLRFLPSVYAFAYFGIALAAVVLLLVERKDTGRTGAWYLRCCEIILGRPAFAATILALGLATAFIAFRLKTYFLGDGYNILAVFSLGDTYYLKWTESGAILTVRALQSMLGGYTRETVQQVLVPLSILSGVVTSLNLVYIARRISPSPKSFALTLPTLLFSGSTLLFFGYLEFYPFLWAIATSFLNAAIYYLTTSRRLWLVVVLFGLAAFIHLQTLMWMPGIAFVLYESLARRRASMSLRKAFVILVIAGAIAATGMLIWLYRARIDIQHVFLPLLSGRPASPDYAVFSPKHLADIGNLLLVLAPGVLALVALFARGATSVRDTLKLFFGVLSLGSLAFLVLIDPDLGIGRDWDLMSLSLLAPILFLLRLLHLRRPDIRPVQALAYAIVTLTATTLYISTAVRVDASETRFLSLLKHYGSKNRSGWAILSSYYADQKNWERQQQVNQEMEKFFPDEAKLVQTWEDLDRGNYGRALSVARQLYETDPHRSDYIQAYAQALAKNRQYSPAIELYAQALKLRPYHAQQRKDLGLVYLESKDYNSALRELGRAWRQDKTITAAAEGIALAYIYQRQYDSALAYAQQLLTRDPHSPGGHLIEMTVALNRGDQRQAKAHYEQYLVYGSARSDYENIRSYYGPYFQ